MQPIISPPAGKLLSPYVSKIIHRRVGPGFIQAADLQLKSNLCVYQRRSLGERGLFTVVPPPTTGCSLKIERGSEKKRGQRKSLPPISRCNVSNNCLVSFRAKYFLKCLYDVHIGGKARVQDVEHVLAAPSTFSYDVLGGRAKHLHVK